MEETMKKITLFLALIMIFPALMLLMSSCGSEKKDEKYQPFDGSFKAGGYTYSIITDYLYEVTYDNYEQYRSAAEKFFAKYNPKKELGGCSSVQNGMIRGRNYDWTYDDEPEFVIHVPAKEGRHASIGVAATTEINAYELLEAKESSVYDIIPYITLDGINDAGLTVNINVVGYGEKGEYEMKTPDDESDDVCPLMVPRLLLDGAGSIDEAIELLKGMDIYSVGKEEEAHFMISGPQSKDDSTFNTVVVELIPDENKHYQLSIIDFNKGEFVDDKPIMTNFHLTGFDGSVESATKHPMGLERYHVLYDNFGQGKDVPGMLQLMKKVYYTRTYDLYSDEYWYSEFTAGDLDMSKIGEKSLGGDISKAGAFADAVQDAADKYSAMTRDGKTWHTVHTSVYDIENKTLYVVPQEGGFSYEFKLQ